MCSPAWLQNGTVRQSATWPDGVETLASARTIPLPIPRLASRNISGEVASFDGNIPRLR